MKRALPQMKRAFKKGSIIETVMNNFKPEKIGQVRKIKEVQPDTIIFEDTSGISWLWLSKTTTYERENNIIKIYHEHNGERFLDIIYKISYRPRFYIRQNKETYTKYQFKGTF